MTLGKLIICLTLILSAPCALAEPAPLLIYESKEGAKNGMPRNFRDLSSLGINAIASGQFSEKELQDVRKKYPNEKIIIVDLRRESHGFINGEAVSWRLPFDKSNQNKKAVEILSEENLLLNSAKKDQQIVINKISEKDRKEGWYAQVSPQIVTVNQATTEKYLAKKNGFEYKRFPVRDHARPDEAEFQKIVNFIKTTPSDQKIYVHCAGGRGRTTTFLTLFDIIKNGQNFELKDILERQNKAGGSKLDHTSEKEEWLSKLSQERLEMIQKFYEREVK